MLLADQTPPLSFRTHESPMAGANTRHTSPIAPHLTVLLTESAPSMIALPRRLRTRASARSCHSATESPLGPRSGSRRG